MRTTIRARSLASAGLALVLLALAPATALAQFNPSSFTYQGELNSAGTAYTGSADVQFRLFPSINSAVPIGVGPFVATVDCVEGRFTTLVDFLIDVPQGAYLEISVRAPHDPTNSLPFITLAPRQPLTPAPIAKHALNADLAANATAAVTAQNADNATNAANSARLEGFAASFFLNANNLNSGVVPSARFQGSYLSQLSFTNTLNAFTGNGSGLTALNATNISSGTLADARLSTNVALLTGTQTFTGAKTFSSASNSFTGSGAGLTALNASNLSSGTVSDVRLSTNVSLLSAAQTYLAQRTFNARALFNGDVGIGATPSAKLHVADGASGVLSFSTSTSAIFERNAANYIQVLSPNDTERGIAFGDPVSGFSGGIYYDGAGAAADSMSFRTGGNASRLFITGAGDVGIGTGTPAARLHVLSNIDVSAAGGGSFIIGSTAGINLRMDGNEIQGFSNGVVSALSLNASGGTTSIGASANTTSLTVLGAAGDAAVDLPNSSISAAEILDEPGLAAASTSSFEALAVDSWDSVASRTLTAPAAGFAVIIATTEVARTGIHFSDTYFEFGVARSLNAGPLNSQIFTQSIPSSPSYATVTTHAVFAVAAGNNAFYFNIRAAEGDMFAYHPHITIMYMPTAHGTVDVESP